MSPNPPSLNPEPIRVLVVDDNYSLLETVELRLEKWGYRVTVTANGQEALALLEKNDYHVVLADLRMSPVTGWEVVELANSRETTEVLVMTGYASLDSSLEALHRNVYDFLPKPLDFDQLERTLRNASNKSELARENKRLFQELSRKAEELEAEVQKVRTELEEVTIRDELTGLYNYRYLRAILDQEVSRSLRYGRPLSLAMLDLDFFKRINDTQGHSVGNEVLARVAGILAKAMRKTDAVCRYGGDEFAIVFPETNKDRARSVLSRVLERIKEEKIPVEGARILTVSAGLASCPEDAGADDALIEKADDALYRAKKEGRDRLVAA
jgi:diguanylate cyclase (GGDEF)-like protein